MSSDYALSGDHGDQLALDGMQPVAGDRYRNRHTGLCATVVRVQRRRRLWVVIRESDREHEVGPNTLAEHYDLV